LQWTTESIAGMERNVKVGRVAISRIPSIFDHMGLNSSTIKSNYQHHRDRACPCPPVGGMRRSGRGSFHALADRGKPCPYVIPPKIAQWCSQYRNIFDFHLLLWSVEPSCFSWNCASECIVHGATPGHEVFERY